ncbi:hypothetical protein BaRGS_00006747, partial [Batillaria attramentaria]
SLFRLRKSHFCLMVNPAQRARRAETARTKAERRFPPSPVFGHTHATTLPEKLHHRNTLTSVGSDLFALPRYFQPVGCYFRGCNL